MSHTSKDDLEPAISIALIGTRGVPAHYGGFETCVEEVGTRLAKRGHRVTVYCRDQAGVKRTDTFGGMRLVYLPAVRRRSLETLTHTGLSAIHQVFRRDDVAVVFNCANAPWLPVLRARNIPVATHVDGLEWKRAKWGNAGRRYYRAAERLAVRWSDALIADASGIADYYRETHGVETELISYGAPVISPRTDRLAELHLQPGSYHLVVARFEPENHVLEIVRGYAASNARLPLIVVGSAPYADEYTRSIRGAADDRTRFIGGIWDQDLLDQLYSGASTYLHGHSVGGTNPSLLRAIGAGAATIAFDVIFNRDVLGASGEFFSTPAQLAEMLVAAETDVTGLEHRRVLSLAQAAEYDWDDVTDRYEQLCLRLAGRPTLMRGLVAGSSS